jgi:hypothetical protein
MLASIIATKASPIDCRGDALSEGAVSAAGKRRVFVWALFALLLAAANGATADSSKTVSTPTLTMTGLRGSVPASTSRTVQTGAVIMTGLRGSVPASTSLNVQTNALTMAGLRGAVAPSTSKTVTTSGLAMTGLRGHRMITH